MIGEDAGGAERVCREALDARPPRGHAVTVIVPTFVLDLSIHADDWLRYYSGSGMAVVARARDGRRVRFAARHLHPFIARDGIRGTFRLEVDAASRFVAIDRLGDAGWTG